MWAKVGRVINLASKVAETTIFFVLCKNESSNKSFVTKKLSASKYSNVSSVPCWLPF